MFFGTVTTWAKQAGYSEVKPPIERYKREEDRGEGGDRGRSLTDESLDSRGDLAESLGALVNKHITGQTGDAGAGTVKFLL
jgi:hypothetical protein